MDSPGAGKGHPRWRVGGDRFGSWCAPAGNERVDPRSGRDPRDFRGGNAPQHVDVLRVLGSL